MSWVGLGIEIQDKDGEINVVCLNEWTSVLKRFGPMKRMGYRKLTEPGGMGKPKINRLNELKGLPEFS